MKRAVSGIRSSGNLHLGNYLGMIKPGLALQEEFQCLYFIADLHALTTNKDPKALRSQTLDVVCTWLALGLDLDKHIIYAQSDLPMVCEYAWYLSCVTGMGFLEKAHAYKDAKANMREVNHGVFAYPVLMAADILLYDANVVPVAKDQKQHVEMARDIAGSFNALYGADLMTLPQPLIKEEVMTIPGLDGRKMSKSYNNEIPLFCSEKQLRKKVMSITTDSTALEDPKSLSGTLIGDLYKLFASESQYKDLEAQLNKGGLGWGHAKEALFEAINLDIGPHREKYNALREDTDALLKVLENGKQRAAEIAIPNINKIRNAVGVGKKA